MITIDALGIHITTLPENLTRLISEIKQIYPDIIVDQDTPTGQQLGIFAKVETDINENAAFIINQFDPDKSVGIFLDMISKLCGITRLPATRSQVTLTIRANAPKTLPQGFRVQDINGIEWQAVNEISLSKGDNTALFECVTFGAINSPSGSINKPSQVYSEIDSYTNLKPATAGKDEESDEEFRARRQRSTYNPSLTITGAIESAIADLPNVTSAIVYQNDQDTTDNKGLPPHSIWAIVDGGNDYDIAEVIAKKKTVGANMKGIEEVCYIDTSRPVPQNISIRFSRPSDIPLYIKLQVKVKSGVTDQGLKDLIKQNLSKVTYAIGESAFANNLYCSFVNKNSNFYALNLQVSKDNSNYTEGELTLALNERFVISPSNIEIVEIKVIN
ncbi:MAG: baseplate J/gp47 family protein [Campylobacteraceae bacterium]|jgi:uncharacterized phage protein gp47/JayE|nr:baseplate J/gp47 family protein [Campylobacteraceae bacterium]